MKLLWSSRMFAKFHFKERLNDGGVHLCMTGIKIIMEVRRGEKPEDSAVIKRSKFGACYPRNLPTDKMRKLVGRKGFRTP